MNEGPSAPRPQISEANAPFYEAAASGEFVLQRCEQCRRWIYYPRMLCPYCLSERVAWTPAAGRGELHSYSIVYHPAHPYFNDKIPIILAAVRLAEGPIMVASMTGDISRLRIGAPAHVTFDLRVDGVTIPRFKLDDE